MPRQTANPTELIKDRDKRVVAFCRLKKELLRRAMELSQTCANEILMVIYDDTQHKMTYFSSKKEFSLKSAH